MRPLVILYIGNLGNTGFVVNNSDIDFLLQIGLKCYYHWLKGSPTLAGGTKNNGIVLSKYQFHTGIGQSSTGHFKRSKRFCNLERDRSNCARKFVIGIAATC